MPALQIIFDCDHTSSVTNTYTKTNIPLIRGAGASDVILPDTVVTSILGVRKADATLISSSNYYLYTHNQIYWSTPVLAIGSTYYMDAIYKVTNVTTCSDNSSCDICGGLSWMANMISSTGSMKYVVNIKKVAQDFIKVLLTEKGTDRLYPNYGTKLNAILRESVADDVVLKMEVSAAVSDAESQLKKIQNTYINPVAAELLQGVQVLDVVFDRTKTNAQVSIRLTNLASHGATVNLAL